MLMEEWFRLGDRELSMKIEVSPMMDRRKPNIPRGQVGFIDYIVRPLFVNWAQLFAVSSVCLDNLSANRQRWNELNADPEANNVQFHMERYKALRDLQLHEPIRYHPDTKTKKSDVLQLDMDLIAVSAAKSDGHDRSQSYVIQDVPFTPEQAMALHVSYGDLLTEDQELTLNVTDE